VRLFDVHGPAKTHDELIGEMRMVPCATPPSSPAGFALFAGNSKEHPRKRLAR
jgi:hypothetical protein